MEGVFSIREYASRMRSIKVVNCWPFDDTMNEETIRSLLPPITVNKFSWWLDELENTHPESPQISPKKSKNFGETSSKAKPKPPKKRSIVEIFAVAPPVERVVSEEDDEESSLEKNPLFKEGKRKKKKKMKISTDVSLRAVNKIKKTQIAQKQMDRSVPNKENYDKLKLQVQDKGTENSSSLHSKDFDHNRDFVPTLKRKLSVQHHKKPEPCEAFKLIDENQHPGFPPRGILKNNGDTFHLQQAMKCTLQEAVQVNHCRTKMAKKHVTFSKKDVYDDVSFRIEKEVGGGLPTKNEYMTTWLAGSINKMGYSRIPDISERSLLDHSNQDWCAVGHRDAPHDPMVVRPRFFRLPVNRYYSSNISTYRRPHPISPPLHFDEYLRTYNVPPVAHLFDMEKRKHTLSESNTANSLQFQSLPHFPRKDFVGLPLNSQGELIRSNSSAKGDVTQKINPNVCAAHSFKLALPRNSHHSELGMNQLNLFPVENYVKENPVAVIPSRLGIVEAQTEQNTNLYMDCRPFRDSDIMWRGDEQVHRTLENEKLQSTMRLMGKEFTVCGSGIQGSKDGDIWKDKQIVHQNVPSSGNFRETYAFPHFDDRAVPMYPSVFVARKTDSLYPSLAPGTLYNNKAFFEPFIRRNKSRLFTLDLPTPTVAHQEPCPCVIPTSMQLKNSQNLPHSPISAIRFPFLLPELDERTISTWSHRSGERSFESFDVKKKETLFSSSLSHNHRYLRPGSNHGTDSSEHNDCHIFFPMSSFSASQTSLPSFSLPYYPGMLMPKHYMNQTKLKERKKTRIGKRSKSQISALSTASFKPFKRPILGSHEYAQCDVRKRMTPAGIGDTVDLIEDACGLYPTKIKSGHVICGEYEGDKDEETISCSIDKSSDGAKRVVKAHEPTDLSHSSFIDQQNLSLCIKKYQNLKM